MESAPARAIRRVQAAVPAAVGKVGVQALTITALAEAAHEAEATVREVTPDDVNAHVLVAYARLAEVALGEFRDGLEIGGHPRHAFRSGVGRLLEHLARDPDAAHFCVVGTLFATRPVLLLRDCYRRRYVRAVAARRGAEGPELEDELVVGALFYTIARLLELDEGHRLPHHLDEVLDATDAFRPAPLPVE